MIYEVKFLISLFVTLVIEFSVVILILKKYFKHKTKIKDILFISLIASSLTLPYLWFILPVFIKARCYFFIGEMLVILIESVVYNKFLKLELLKSLILSFFANLTSFIFGLILFI